MSLLKAIELQKAYEEGRVIVLPDAWIGVEDRLPEYYGRCLVVAEGLAGIFSTMATFMPPKAFVISDAGGQPPVTHWMPLPEPPKEG